MTIQNLSKDQVADGLAEIASRAGSAIMAIYGQAFKVQYKSDRSPVTEADLAADAIIADGLAKLGPSIPVLSEETVDETDPANLGEIFFVVDPLDGTKEFVARNGDFTVNIALVHQGVPVCAAVFAPVQGRMWLAGDSARVCDVTPGDAPLSANTETIHCVAPPPTTLRAVASRSHRDSRTEAYLSSIGPCKTVSVGSSLKLCLVAEGKADVYPRVSPTMVWDIAAGVAVVEAAGGTVLDQHNAPLRFAYGKDGWRNGPFVAWGCKGRAAKHGIGA